MDGNQLAALAEDARRRLLAKPREAVWEGVLKNPFDSAFVFAIFYLLLIIPFGLASFFVNLVFDVELWDIPEMGFVYPILAVFAFARYLIRDNEKKYQNGQKHFKNALPSSIAEAYCKQFEHRDDLWWAMDHLWREGRARSFARFVAIVVEGIERRLKRNE